MSKRKVIEPCIVAPKDKRFRAQPPSVEPKRRAGSARFPADFEVAISTVDRTPHFLHRTLASFYEQGGEAAHHLPVRLVVCGGSPDYIGSPWLTGRFAGRKLDTSIELPDGAQLDKIERTPPEGRCLLNFRRQLGEGYGPLLALQDDIAFTSDWVGKLDRLVEQLERHRIQMERRSSYLLALYCAYRLPAKMGDWAFYPQHLYYGNQAIYMSAYGRDRLRRYIDAELAAGRPKSDDMMVKESPGPARLDIYAAIPNLVQHIGDTSALGLHFHQSPTFQP